MDTSNVNRQAPHTVHLRLYECQIEAILQCAIKYYNKTKSSTVCNEQKLITVVLTCLLSGLIK